MMLLSLFLLLVSPVSIQSLEADFTQYKTVALLQEVQVSHGHFSYQAPDYLRWEYTDPTVMVWTTNAGETTSPYSRRVLSLILRTVNGDYLQDNADFAVTVTEQSTYLLTPKKRELRHLFSSILIRIVPSSGLADQVVMTEKNGDTTHITFNYTH